MDHWLTYLILIIQYGLITDLLSNIIWLCSVVVLYIVHYGWCNQVSWPRLRRLRGDASSSSWAKAASTTHRWSINHQSPVTWAVLYLFYLESCMFVYRPSPQEVWMLLFFSHFSLKNLKRAITPLNRDKSLQSRNHLNPSSTIRHGPAWCWNQKGPEPTLFGTFSEPRIRLWQLRGHQETAMASGCERPKGTI